MFNGFSLNVFYFFNPLWETSMKRRDFITGWLRFYSEREHECIKKVGFTHEPKIVNSQFSTLNEIFLQCLRLKDFNRLIICFKDVKLRLAAPGGGWCGEGS